MTNHPNRSRRHTAEIRLLGGYPARLNWTDGDDEGDIVVYPEFLSYIHEHTRKDAIAKAGRIAPSVVRWTCVA